MKFYNTHSGVVGFYESPTYDGSLRYVATVFPEGKQPWSINAQEVSQSFANLVAELYKEAMYGKESAEPR